MTLRSLLIAAAATLIAAPLAAHEFKQGDLSIAHPWTRQTAAGQSVGGGFTTITNGGKANDRLLDASSPAAARVELHDMTMDGGVMRMRPVVGGLAVPAGGALALQPGGQHLMLMGLKAPLELGALVPVTLRFERAGTVTVQLKVEAVTYGAGGDHAGH